MESSSNVPLNHTIVIKNRPLLAPISAALLKDVNNVVLLPKKTKKLPEIVQDVEPDPEVLEHKLGVENMLSDLKAFLMDDDDGGLGIIGRSRSNSKRSDSFINQRKSVVGSRRKSSFLHQPSFHPSFRKPSTGGEPLTSNDPAAHSKYIFGPAMSFSKKLIPLETTIQEEPQKEKVTLLY
jgi:hypothetical protein